MRNALFLIFLIVFISSCQKSVQNLNKLDSEEVFFTTVREKIATAFIDEDLADLDYSRIVKSKLINGRYYVRIAYKGRSVSEMYLSIITNSELGIMEASVVEISGLKKPNILSARISDIVFDVKRRNLFDKKIDFYRVKNGYSLKINTWGLRSDSEEAPDTDVNQDFLPENYLPPVIVVGYIHSDFGGGGGGFTFFIGTPGIEGGGGSQVAQTYDPVTGDVGNQLLEIEFPMPKPKADLKKLLSCFSGVSSYGNVSYSVKLCADLPVNSNSNAYFNSSLSPGHSFLTLSKVNGDQQITQSVGFYPGDNGEVNQIKDNGLNEFNASITMNLNEAQFKVLLQQLELLSNRVYSLNDFNCTDFALQAFNSIRSNPIAVSEMEIYVGYPGVNSSVVAAFSGTSPQSLFNKLNELKNAGGVESANILIDRTHNSKAPLGHGECN